VHVDVHKQPGEAPQLRGCVLSRASMSPRRKRMARSSLAHGVAWTMQTSYAPKARML
jgi:hypothetical protein